MSNVIRGNFGLPMESSEDALLEILRLGARRILAQSVEAEVQDYVSRFADCRDERGRRLVVRNGHMPEREIQTRLGPNPVRQPRVNDKRVDANGRRLHFESTILPPYLRRTKSIEELIPWLYLKGISIGDFADALQAILGPDAPGLSASTVTRLKGIWEEDYKAWTKRSLVGKRYVYHWVDGIYFKVRLDGEKQCMLVIMGATIEGRKELIAVEDGFRESKLSWLSILNDLKARRLDEAPELAVGDGALGFWAALKEAFPKTRAQRCCVHKTANVLNYLPKSQQTKAKQGLHEIWRAATKAEAEKAFDAFIINYRAKYEKATACLAKDRDTLLAFYDFPAEHWKHIRTTNPIESTFATVRLRTERTKGCGSRMATLTMVYRLAQCAEKTWRRLGKPEYLVALTQNVKFVDGVKQAA